MKAWREELAQWSKEAPKVLDPARSPGWPADPARTREVQRDSLRWGLGMVLGAFVAPVLVGIGAMAYLDDLGWRGASALVGIASLAVAFTGLSLAVKAAGERLDARSRRRVEDALEARGEATLIGEAVGVSYADARWRHPTLGDDMDHGVLRIDFDRLTFVGEASRFELPASAVVGTEVRRFDQAFAGALPRLYVTWRGEGGLHTFSVALPYRRSLRRRVTEASELRERIEAWRGERRPAFGARAFQAPPTGRDLALTPARGFRAGTRAKLLATLVAVPTAFTLMAGLVTLFVALGWDFGPFSVVPTMFGVCLWLVLAQSFERRMPPEQRHPDNRAETTPVAGLGEARVEEQATVRQRV